jgi:hypothetical protein
LIQDSQTQERSDILTNIYELKKDLSKQGVFFCLSGPISQELVAEIGSTLEHHIAAGKSTFLGVFSAFVENAQNIIRYSDEKKDDLSLGIIAVGHEDGHYFVLCGNMVENDKIEKLVAKLTKIQKMNKDELKEYYKKQRRGRPPKESKGGAGLGFIEMARRASRPIEFSFKKINDKFHFFSMKTVV